MAQNAKGTQAQGGSTTQQSGGGKSSSGTPQQSSNTAAQSATQGTQSDQQRSIQTSRNADRSLSTSRASGSPVRGIAASPFWLMRRIAEDMDHMLEDFGFAGDAAAFGDRPMRSGTRDRGMWTPQVETFRRGDKLVVRADLPGLSKDDIKVELDDNALVISGERSDEHEDNREGYYVTERSYGQFYRAVPLPEGVSGDQCEATFKDGVLEVTLKAPKEEQKAKQIEIK